MKSGADTESSYGARSRRSPTAGAPPSRAAGCVAAPDHRPGRRTTRDRVASRRRPRRRHRRPPPSTGSRAVAVVVVAMRRGRSGLVVRPHRCRAAGIGCAASHRPAPGRTHGAPSPGRSGRPGTRSRGSRPPGGRGRAVPVRPRHSSGVDGPVDPRVRLDRLRTRRTDRPGTPRRWAVLAPSSKGMIAARPRSAPGWCTRDGRHIAQGGARMSSPFIFIATNRLKPGRLDRERQRVPASSSSSKPTSHG